jgi:hypothetical protein
MTVGKFGELIVEMLGQQTHVKIEDRVVLALADSLRGAILHEMFGSSGSITGEYVKRFVQPIQTEGDNQFVYLPCDICTIQNNLAYQFIGPESEETNFIPLKHATVASINSLEARALAGRSGYWTEGRKLYLRFLPPSQTTLLMKLVPNLVWMYENTPDEELMADATVEALLIEKCFAALKLKAQVPEDKTADES